MKQILIPFGADSARDVPIEAASQLAHRHNGQITGIFYPRLPDPVIVDPMSGRVEMECKFACDQYVQAFGWSSSGEKLATGGFDTRC